MLETSSQRRLLSVQALRGLAAFFVLLYHCAELQRAGLPDAAVAERALLSGVWNQGFSGVDLFFVISGFIMVYVTRKMPRTFKSTARFLYSRASRIYPLWWVFAGLMMVYFWMTYGQPAPPDKVASLSEILPYTLKSLFLIQDEHFPVLGVGWTLIHEVYFYIVFAGILLLPKRFLSVALGAWGLIILIHWIGFNVPKRAQSIPQLITSPLTLEFIAGAILGLLITNKVYWKPMLVTACGVVGLIAALIVGTHHYYFRMYLYLAPFAALVYGLSALEHQDKLSVPAWMVQMGDWSYSLYLSHMFVLLALRRVLEKVAPYMPEPLKFQADGIWDNLLFVVISIPLSVIISAISYRMIEQPLLRMSRKILKRKPLAVRGD